MQRNIRIVASKRMVDSRADSSLATPVLTSACANRSSRPSALEKEVAELFDQLRNPLLRYVLSAGLPPQDGEEVIQEVFLSLFQHLRRGKPRTNLRAWAFRVAHNLALKQRYAHQRQELLMQPEESITHWSLDPDPNPEEALAARQRRRRLLAVISALPEQDRHCLYLRAEGLRYREIAKVLGMSLGAVSICLVRSLARLGRADTG